MAIKILAFKINLYDTDRKLEIKIEEANIWNFPIGIIYVPLPQWKVKMFYKNLQLRKRAT